MNADLYVRIMDLYAPSCRYLKDVRLDGTQAEGVFRLEAAVYTAKKPEHMTAIEAQICLNQLAFYAFGEWLSNNALQYSLPMEEYVRLMGENMFILRSDIGFRKQIRTDNEITGVIALQDAKKFRDTYFAFLRYDLEQGKSSGSMKLAITLDGRISSQT